VSFELVLKPCWKRGSSSTAAVFISVVFFILIPIVVNAKLIVRKSWLLVVIVVEHNRGSRSGIEWNGWECLRWSCRERYKGGGCGESEIWNGDGVLEGVVSISMQISKAESVDTWCTCEQS
jgi:hypothetical protein